MDIINSIKFCRDKRKVANVYLDKEDTCHHLTGYITACNDDEVLIAHINTRGDTTDLYMNMQAMFIVSIMTESMKIKSERCIN